MSYELSVTTFKGQMKPRPNNTVSSFLISPSESNVKHFLATLGISFFIII